MLKGAIVKPLHRTFTLLTLVGLVGASACGGSGTDGGDAAGASIGGAALKGRIDAAKVEVLDSDGQVVATGDVIDGRFHIDGVPLHGPFIWVRTVAGRYQDEATGRPVVIPSGRGLAAMVPVDDLRTRGHELVLTPESTIVSGIARRLLDDGLDSDVVMERAAGYYHDEFMMGTSPVAMLGAPELLIRFGRVLDPTTEQGAMAGNRAMAFSYLVRGLGLAPEDAFDLMEALSRDLHDGLLHGARHRVPVSFTAMSGEPFQMDAHDPHSSYGQARARMMDEELHRVLAGAASSEARHRLELMGMDLAPYDDSRLQRMNGIEATAANLEASDLPEFQHLPELGDRDGDPDNDQGFYTLTAQGSVDVTIRAPGRRWITPMLRYNGMQLPPVIRARRGEEMFLELDNQLGEDTTIHWHGFEVPGSEDGGPTDPVPAGTRRTYQFTLDQPAASLWFHPHPHGATGEQVYRGLAGVLILSDEISRTLQAQKRLPQGVFDLPVVLQDRLFNREVAGVRTLAYSSAGTGLAGMLGDTVLVNGVNLPRLSVETRQYLLRLYNGSNARTYDLALSDGVSFHLVGSDGGLLPEPVRVEHVTLGAGERADVVIDFAHYAVGERVMLVSRSFMGGAMMGMGGGAHRMRSGHMGGDSGSGMPYGSGDRFDVMRFDVDVDTADDVSLYDRLRESAEIHSRWESADATRTRSFLMTWDMHGGSGRFLINGKSFAMDRIDELVEPGATEIWEIRNWSPAPHPFHAHAIQWQVLDRNGRAPTGTETGWKDTVLLRPGETVRMIGHFGLRSYGKYVYHCHILEHEDAGMMGLFEVR
jgi:FtsP/CotA-like multicopper oxidase with cupredoxin domain